MANINFGGSLKSDTQSHNLKVYMNDLFEIYIQIEMDIDHGYAIPHFICLDIDTAVQFSRQLRKSISEAKNQSNG